MQTKSLKKEWQDAPKQKQRQTPAPGYKPYASFGERLAALEAQAGFLVYDGRQNYWGHAVTDVEPAEKKPEGADMPVYKVNFIRQRQPNDGDRVVLEMESGKNGLFLLFDTQKLQDPDDFTRAKAVLLDGDYKGGVGFEGKYDSENATKTQQVTSGPFKLK